MRRRVFLVTACVATLISREAGADIYHIKSSSTLKTDKGSELRLPPGYFLDEKTWSERDLEMRRLQEQETRILAENKSLRKSATSPVWLTVAVSAAGILVGAAVAVLK